MTKKNIRLSGAEIVTKVLLEENVDTVFGYPGGQVLHIYNELEKKRRRIKHILTAHEQGAAHAADGYARRTGRVGVVIATSGPGAANLVTGIATAYMDSVPMVVITGNVSTDQIGRDSFQELDITDITMPITKHNYIVKDVRALYKTIKEAFVIARSGRCGPVLVDIPKDVQIARCNIDSGFVHDSGDALNSKKSELERAAALIKDAERPFIYCGGGAVRSNAGAHIEKLAGLIDAPIGCSLMGLSALSENSPHNLGFAGMYGNPVATAAMRSADLIIAVGVRFTDRAIGGHGEYVSKAKILQFDIDSAEVDKNVSSTLHVVGDVRNALRELCGMLNAMSNPEWNLYINKLPKAEASKNGTFLHPFEIIDAAAKYQNCTTVVTDVGQHQMWVAQRYPITASRPLLTSGGLGTMGFGLGAAIGAATALKGEKVLLFTGDGSFGMNLNELATAVSYKLPIVIIIMNNKSLGMVKQWQKATFNRLSQTQIQRQTDFVRLSEAFGGYGETVCTISALEGALKRAFAKGIKLPYVIDCHISPEQEVETPEN